MEPKVFKCEGGFCTNKACSYSTPALPDVTSDDWSLIFLYLERHDRILDQRLPFTTAQAAQSHQDWLDELYGVGRAPGLPEDYDEPQDLQDGGQDQVVHLDLPEGGGQCETDASEAQDEHHVMPRPTDDQPAHVRRTAIMFFELV